MRKHIRCGTLFDGLGDEGKKDQTIVIEDGVISYVGPTAKAPKPNGEEVVDHSQWFVMPGMSDYHVHLSYGNARCEEDIDFYAPVEFRALRGMFMAQRVLLAGYTSMNNPGGSSRVELSIRNAINANLFEGPRITTTGPYVTSRQGLTDWYPTWIGSPKPRSAMWCGARTRRSRRSAVRSRTASMPSSSPWTATWRSSPMASPSIRA